MGQVHAGIKEIDTNNQSTLSAGTCSIILSKKLVQQFGKYLNLKTKTSYNHLILL